MNDVHHDYMESFLLPNIMTQLHDKLAEGDLIDGFHKMKPVLKAEKQNEKMPPMLTSAFRELMLNPPKDKTSFENIIIKYIPSSFVSQDDPYTPTIHRAIHGFLASYTKSSQTPTKNPRSLGRHKPNMRSEDSRMAIVPNVVIRWPMSQMTPSASFAPTT